jgi:hypothetical protein
VEEQWKNMNDQDMRGIVRFTKAMNVHKHGAVGVYKGLSVLVWRFQWVD